MSDYESMTDAELEAANHALQAQRFELGEEQDKIAAVRDKRGAEAAATQILEGLSPGELDVLIQAAAAKLSVSAESPGAEEDEG